MERLWAPWRLSYVTGEKPAGCALCSKCLAPDDATALVAWRGETCLVVLNLHPYNNGHIMVMPIRHVADLTELTDAESRESQMLISETILVLRQIMNPEGFNVGLNMGTAAGAGIASHLHWHVVPRWIGDTNFMPVLAAVTVIPQHLESTLKLVRDAFDARMSKRDNDGTDDEDHSIPTPTPDSGMEPL